MSEGHPFGDWTMSKYVSRLTPEELKEYKRLCRRCDKGTLTAAEQSLSTSYTKSSMRDSRNVTPSRGPPGKSCGSTPRRSRNGSGLGPAVTVESDPSPKSAPRPASDGHDDARSRTTLGPPGMALPARAVCVICRLDGRTGT
jgi:hypothetical protein